MKNTDNRLHAGIERFASEVITERERNIKLLEAIEITITMVNRITSQLLTDADNTAKFNDAVEDCVGYIDQDNTIAEKIENTQSKTKYLYDLLIKIRDSGRNCSWISDDDGIDDSCNEAIAAAAELHNNLNDLRWHIMEHDADYSKVSETFNSADDLIKSLTA